MANSDVQWAADGWRAAGGKTSWRGGNGWGEDHSSSGQPVPIPSETANSDSQWAAGGWTADGWSSWTGGNGGEDQARRIDSDAMQKRIELLEARRIDSDAMNKRIELLEARVSRLEKELAALRQAEQAEVGSPVLPEPKHTCDWHEHRANAGEAVSVIGIQETNLNSWLDHLRNTLYSEDSRPLDAFEGKIRANWQRIEVTAGRSKANRFFFVRCKLCDQYSYGEFGAWAEQRDRSAGHDRPAQARDALAKFFNNQGVPSGKSQV